MKNEASRTTITPSGYLTPLCGEEAANAGLPAWRSRLAAIRQTAALAGLPLEPVWYCAPHNNGLYGRHAHKVGQARTEDQAVKHHWRKSLKAGGWSAGNMSSSYCRTINGQLQNVILYDRGDWCVEAGAPCNWESFPTLIDALGHADKLAQWGHVE